MRKLGTALLATLVVAGLVFAAFLGTRPPPVSVHVVRVSRAVEFKGFLVEFAISNSVDRTFMPKRLEHWTGTIWKECPQPIGSFTEPSSSRVTCMLGTIAVPDGRLRMVMNSSRSVKG